MCLQAQAAPLPPLLLPLQVPPVLHSLLPLQAAPLLLARLLRPACLRRHLLALAAKWHCCCRCWCRKRPLLEVGCRQTPSHAAQQQPQTSAMIFQALRQNAAGLEAPPLLKACREARWARLGCFTIRNVIVDRCERGMCTRSTGCATLRVLGVLRLVLAILTISAAMVA